MQFLARISRRQCRHFLPNLNAAGKSWQCAASESQDPAHCAGTTSKPAPLSDDEPPRTASMLWLQAYGTRAIGAGSEGGERRAVCNLEPARGVFFTLPHWSGSSTMPALARSFGSQTTASTTASDHTKEAQHDTGNSSHAGSDSGASSTQSGTEVERGKAGQLSVVPELECDSGSITASSLSRAGWTRQEIWNAPNAISMARLVSGPIIAGWIIAGEWQTALIALAISGVHLFSNSCGRCVPIPKWYRSCR